MKNILLISLLLTIVSTQAQNIKFFNNLFSKAEKTANLTTSAYENDYIEYTSVSKKIFVNIGLMYAIEAADAITRVTAKIENPTVVENLDKIIVPIMTEAEKGTTKTVFAGAEVTGKIISLHWYTIDANAKNKINTALKASTKSPFSVTTAADPNWDYYNENLLPSETTLQAVKNEKTIQMLKSRGDISSRIRPVRHILAFKSEAGRTAFLKNAQNKGFKLLETSTADEEYGFYIDIVRNDKTDSNTINGISTMLIEWANETGGAYVSWETAIVKK